MYEPKRNEVEGCNTLPLSTITAVTISNLTRNRVYTADLGVAG
jgi:hypothetical protein